VRTFEALSGEHTHHAIAHCLHGEADLLALAIGETRLFRKEWLSLSLSLTAPTGSTVSANVAKTLAKPVCSSEW
jgi:hypothetical protein